MRSCVIAKIAGMTPEQGDAAGTELLQISPEEQKRAARTAALFSEEELTRFLQVLLRTFDELGYRQEQRFHFELGLLKLVHLRRLLPVEEVLSALGGAAKPAAGARPQALAAPVARTAEKQTAAKPVFSPFEQNQARRKYDGIASGPAAVPMASPPPVVSAAPIVAAPPVAVIETSPVPVPDPVPVPAPVPVSIPSPLEEQVERMPEVTIPPPVFDPVSEETKGDEGGLQQVVVQRLAVAGQASAADALGDATWTLDGGEVKVQTELSKTMLPVIVNAEAEKIVRGVLREHGGLRLTLLAGTGSAGGAPKKPKAARSGSAQAKAAEHPVIAEAQRLFDAEIQSVIDLSGQE
jgi:DNA polymerase-3 subunit gamma/tau